MLVAWDHRTQAKTMRLKLRKLTLTIIPRYSTILLSKETQEKEDVRVETTIIDRRRVELTFGSISPDTRTTETESRCMKIQGLPWRNHATGILKPRVWLLPSITIYSRGTVQSAQLVWLARSITTAARVLCYSSGLVDVSPLDVSGISTVTAHS